MRRQQFQLITILVLSCAVGIIAAIAAWSHVTIPFSNPYGIVSLLSDIHFNPANNTARFLLMLACPLVSLALLWVLIPSFRERMRSTVFVHAERVEQRLSRRAWIVCLSVAAFSALALPTYIAWGEYDSYHEGESMGVAVSWEHGQTPYRDFTLIHGVMQDPLRSVIAFNLFGRSIGSVRTLESIVKMLCWTCLMAFLLQLFRGSLVRGTVVFTLLWLFALVGGMTIMQRDIVVLIYSIAALGLIRFNHNDAHQNTGARSRPLIYCATLGFISTASFAYSIDRGVYLLLLTILLTVFCFWQQRGEFFRGFFILAGFAALGLLVLGNALRWDFWSFINFCFIQMPKYKDLLDGLIYELKNRFLFFIVLCSALLFAVVARLTMQVVQANGAHRLRRVVADNSVLIYLLLLSLLFYRNVTGRADTTHLEYSIYPLLIMLAYMVLPTVEAMFKTVVDKRSRVIVALALSIPQNITLFNVASSTLLTSNFPVRIPDEQFVSSEEQETVKYLRSELQHGENFVTLTSEESWYYYLNQPCPLRFGMITIAQPTFFTEEILREWPRKNIRFVLRQNDHWANRFEGHGIDESMPRLDSMIRRNYHHVRSIRIPDSPDRIGQEIWERN